jgi:hypothetical protein
VIDNELIECPSRLIRTNTGGAPAGDILYFREAMMSTRATMKARIVMTSFAFVWLSMLYPAELFAQIDLFGNIRDTLDNEWKRNGWESTRVYDVGWNVTPEPVRVQYDALGNPPEVLIAIPDTSKAFTNATPNPGSFPYEAVCKQTIKHTWRITYGITGSLVGAFNSLPGIDSASPKSGGMNLTPGQMASQDAQYSQSLQAMVSVPPMSSVTYQAYYHQRPLTLAFDVDVRIGGSYRFEAFKGNTRSSSVHAEGLGTFYKDHPHPNVQVVDDVFVIVKLRGEYTGAIGTTPGNFTCEARAVPGP